MAKTRNLVLVTALILLGSVAMAQPFESPQDSEADSGQQSSLGGDVIAYNFVMRGLPGNSQEEVEADRSFEREPDEDESFNLSEDEALDIAREELGSGEWNLEESEQSDGAYEFEFVRGESRAKVSVDGSSGRIVEFEAEVEWEPENEESSAVLSGFIQFSREGYSVDTDIEVDEENNEALFELEIEQEDEVGAEVITRRDIREFEDAPPGSYTGTLEVIREDEIVHTEEQDFRVPGSLENESEEDDSEDGLADMSRDELIDEIRSLREEVQSLRDRLDSERPEVPEDNSEENDSSEDDDSDEQESEESESEESSEEESEPEESEAPGNSGQRPGFVSRMLSGIFG